MDTLGIGMRAGKQPMRQGAAAPPPPTARGKARQEAIEEYRLVCDQTNGETLRHARARRARGVA